MALSPIRLVALSNEISADPLGRGYVGMTDQGIADSLNAVNRERNRASMTTDEVFQNIDLAEWKALQESAVAADTQKFTRVNVVLALGEVDPFGQAGAVFTDAFGAGSKTIASLVAARKEAITRARELGLPKVKTGWVKEAKSG